MEDINGVCEIILGDSLNKIDRRRKKEVSNLHNKTIHGLNAECQ